MQNVNVSYGDIEETSPGADRRSLSSNCSLIINNITVEYTGVYWCRIGDKHCSKYVLLIVLTAGISGYIVLHHRAGDDVILRCHIESSADLCSVTLWIYNNIQNAYGHVKVIDGDIVKTSPGADRMNVSSNCSLIINNITVEDAGGYTCWNDYSNRATPLFLNVLTVSPSPPDVDPGRDGDVTLRCSLVRHRYLGPCEQNSIIWVDETGSVLLGEGDGFVSGTGVRTIILYHRAGDDVALQNNVDSSSSNCSDVEWIYSRDTSSASHEEFGSGAGRMDRNCSLIITNITAGDAGLYESRLRDKYNTVVYLSVLTSEYLDCVGNSATRNTQPLLGLSVPGRVSLFGSGR
ncbi:uncharacterized protein LOC133464842 [Cololabis saira]|uniref:uncharacterized protein LOC133464842 n=1 Tax=Cololabis saira TaxID=129043 RepID=UPI002AD46E9D|nr:uncharacterized protein LOC133464842 [Cololabis saira]